MKMREAAWEAAQLLEGWLPRTLCFPKAPGSQTEEHSDPPRNEPLGCFLYKPHSFLGKASIDMRNVHKVRTLEVQLKWLAKALKEPKAHAGALPVRAPGKAMSLQEVAPPPALWPSAYQREQLPTCDGDRRLQGPCGGEGPATATATLERPWRRGVSNRGTLRQPQ